MCPTGTTPRPHLTSGVATSEFRRAFDVLDVDHDGKISSNDLHTFYSSTTTTSSSYSSSSAIVSRFVGDKEMIRAMISVADANKDGFVEYDEFESVLKNGTSKGEQRVNGGGDDGGVMREVFMVMDKDGDGRLGVDDLRTYLSFAGINVADDEIKAMIKLAGGDVRHGVSFHGFVNILALHDYY